VWNLEAGAEEVPQLAADSWRLVQCGFFMSPLTHSNFPSSFFGFTRSSFFSFTKLSRSIIPKLPDEGGQERDLTSACVTVRCSDAHTGSVLQGQSPITAR
jgi:hypothetical protein